MRYETVDTIFRVLKQYPEGTTSPVVAKRLDWPVVKASLQLSKLYNYGVIDRVPAPGRKNQLFRYNLKQHEPINA